MRGGHGNDKTGYVVTVTDTQGDTVNFDYKAKPFARPGFVARATALAAVGLLGVSGCSSDSHASVGAAELQGALVDKLAQAAMGQHWVNCARVPPPV